jgi:hypothetical protein
LAKETTPKFSYDIFFNKGFGAHIQVQADNLDELKTAIADVAEYLDQTGAEPRANDRAAFVPATSGQTGGTAESSASPMERAATAVFGTQKLCSMDGTVMKYVNGGLSRTKTNKDGSPKRFSSRYECPTCQITVWNKD